MKKILFIDNFDSFSQTIIYYLKKNRICLTEIKNNSNYSTSILNDFDGLILSPGPGTPQHSGICTDFLKYAINNKIPVLGICLGHQVICSYFGSKIVRAEKPMHGYPVKIKLYNSALFKNMDKLINMACYNSLVALKPDEYNIKITAESLKHNYIMAVEHKSLPVFGIQFHPESFMSEKGDEIFLNFRKIL